MPPVKYFLDTHILIWWMERSSQLTPQQSLVLGDYERNKPFGVSDITLAEIGCLVVAGRIQLDRDLRSWLQQATAAPLVRLHRLTPTVIAEIANLPGDFHRDPADRIIVASARLEKATLLTCDRKIIDSGAVATL